MLSIKYIRIGLLGFIFLSAIGCNVFFETDTDLRAQQALKKLMVAQEKYREKYSRYARTLFDMEKKGEYDISYHKGLVYMEIETASEKSYRAIALPAESTTARVFAYDSNKGGYYEMDKEETAKYVLGAFRSIQKEKKFKRINDMSSIFLIAIVAILGIYPMIQKREPGYNPTYITHLVSLPPLFFSLTALNHMNDQMVITPFLKNNIYLSVGLAFICFFVFLKQCRKYYRIRGATSLVGILTSICLSSLFTLWVMIQTLIKYQDL